LSLKTKVDSLSVVWHQNHYDDFFNLASKLVATVFSGLASKSVATVFSGLASKPMATISLDLTSKPMVAFLVEPQNQGI
jgi:hypothetical protein